MELTSTRKKANAITSSILNRIAIRGQRKVADALGINESQISRWKGDFIPKMGMLLAVLEWGVEDDDMARLAREVAAVLTKKKSPAATEDSDQLTIHFDA
ncbi:TPA: lambda phage CII family protein [Salmonella enterica subsp. houtenae serovar Rough:z4,z23:-]